MPMTTGGVYGAGSEPARARLTARRGGGRAGPGARRLPCPRGAVRTRDRAPGVAQDRRGQMTSVPGVDHPEERTEAEITLTGRGVSVAARVEVVQNDRISVRPSVGEFVEQVVVKVGDVVEIFWKHDEGQRALPAEVTAVDQ